jgi:transposase
MTGAGVVDDTLERDGGDVEIRRRAEGQGGLAPLACKTDDTDSLLLATPSQRDLRRSGFPIRGCARCASSPAFARTWSATSRRLRTGSPRRRSTSVAPARSPTGSEPRAAGGWRGSTSPSPGAQTSPPRPSRATHLERQIDEINRRPRAGHADHPYIPLLLGVPGIRGVLASTIASEIGESERLSSPAKLTGYTGLCPRVVQPGERDRRGPLSKHGPTYPRWASLDGDDARAHAPRLSPALPTSAGSASAAGRRSPTSTSPAARPTRSGTR